MAFRRRYRSFGRSRFGRSRYGRSRYGRSRFGRSRYRSRGFTRPRFFTQGRRY